MRGDDIPAFGGPVVMYEAGKILKVGGSTWNNGTNSSATAYIIDTTAGTANVRKMPSMAYPRLYSNSVVLPNGQVLIVGGQTYAQEFSDSYAVLAPELFDPQTETFTVLPAMSVARNYHSIALLLPDGASSPRAAVYAIAPRIIRTCRSCRRRICSTPTVLRQRVRRSRRRLRWSATAPPPPYRRIRR